MKLSWLDRGGRSRLLLFFAGWGMQPEFFSDLRREGYDIAMIYDYRDEKIDIEPLGAYDEIVVMAWSMGVRYATKFIIVNSKLPITKCVAINGSTLPIDDKNGIPTKIYLLTMPLPNRRAVDKFMSRTGAEIVSRYRAVDELRLRSVDELREELAIIFNEVEHNGDVRRHELWDEIFISSADKIFPAGNLREAWGDNAASLTIVPNGEHAIDFAELAQKVFVDKDLVGDNFERSQSSYSAEAKVQKEVAQTLYSIFQADCQSPLSAKRVLEIGSGDGILTRLYQPHFDSSRLELMDLVPQPVEAIGDNEIVLTRGDAETLPFDESVAPYDFIFSSSALQWLNSPKKFLAAIYRLLNPGGCAYFAFYGKGTFSAIASTAGLRYIDSEFCEKLPDAKLVVKISSLKFDDEYQVLRHIRNTGVNSLRRKPLGVKVMRALLESIRQSGNKLDFYVNYLTIKKKQ